MLARKQWQTQFTKNRTLGAWGSTSFLVIWAAGGTTYVWICYMHISVCMYCCSLSWHHLLITLLFLPNANNKPNLSGTFPSSCTDSNFNNFALGPIGSAEIDKKNQKASSIIQFEICLILYPVWQVVHVKRLSVWFEWN